MRLLRLDAIPVYDETMNSSLSSIIKQVVVDENIHETRQICERVREKGVPCSPYVALVHLQKSKEYIQIQDGYWEQKSALISAVEQYIFENKNKFEIRESRSMPEMEEVVRPAYLVDKIPRYIGSKLSPMAFGEAVIKVIQTHQSDLVATNSVIVNFKEAFIKDLYNVLLRERNPMSSLDIALRLFDSKVGVYKKSLKDFVPTKKAQPKVIHHPLHPNEIFRLSRLIELIIDEVISARPEIFIRLADGKVNAYRNHIGIVKIKLTEDNYLTIDMSKEIDVARNVSIIIDANKPFLSKLIKQFRSKVDEEEIESRFYEKLWQAVIQYDEIWGHKFHTFLHRALKNILLDEKSKRKNDLPVVSLNLEVNDKNHEELGNLLSNKSIVGYGDPHHRVYEMRLVEMVKETFVDDHQKVIFLIMDGFKDKEIAANLNKSISDVVAIKKRIKHSPQLMRWLYA